MKMNARSKNAVKEDARKKGPEGLKDLPTVEVPVGDPGGAKVLRIPLRETEGGGVELDRDRPADEEGTDAPFFVTG
jgi:hypothetical protein